MSEETPRRMASVDDEDLDKLADICWWLMGYCHALDNHECSDDSVFDCGHIKALEKARAFIQEVNYEEKQGGNHE